jgi:hypothetical protein
MSDVLLNLAIMRARMAKSDYRQKPEMPPSNVVELRPAPAEEVSEPSWSDMLKIIEARLSRLEDPIPLMEDASSPAITIREIQRAVAKHYNITISDILSVRRTNDVVLPRQIAAYLAKVLTTRSYPEIGRRMGGRDHSTILHAVRKISELVQVDEKLAMDINKLKFEILGGR